jgi:hypothetical protein
LTALVLEGGAHLFRIACLWVETCD